MPTRGGRKRPVLLLTAESASKSIPRLVTSSWPILAAFALIRFARLQFPWGRYGPRVAQQVQKDRARPFSSHLLGAGASICSRMMARTATAATCAERRSRSARARGGQGRVRSGTEEALCPPAPLGHGLGCPHECGGHHGGENRRDQECSTVNRHGCASWST